MSTTAIETKISLIFLHVSKWYHPHIRSNVAIELGLQGLLIVRDPGTDRGLGQELTADSDLLPNLRIE